MLSIDNPVAAPGEFPLVDAPEGDAGFQTAMTWLLRRPEATIARLDEVVTRFGLDEDQERKLRSLADNHLVIKYAQLMRIMRHDEAFKALPLAVDFLPRDVIDGIYYRDFEPTASHVRLDDLRPRFVGFLANLPDDAEGLRRLPPYARDLFRYEEASYHILGMRLKDHRAPPDSLLRHTAFILVDAAHDVPDILRRDPGPEGVGLVGIAPSPVTLLFVRVTGKDNYRLFKVDESLKAFLQAHATPGGPRDLARPPAYDALVDLGLCKPA